MAMNVKELKSLSRGDLLELLLAQTERVEQMEIELADAKERAAARDIIRNAGCGEFFGHGTGHGVGIEIHEAPTLNPKSGEILKKGDIVTVEPGIYLPSQFGVRIEDMAYITENGCENLTKSPKNLIIL